MNAQEDIFQLDVNSPPSADINKPIIGWRYDYTPMEVILAAGCHPWHINGQYFPTRKMSEYLPNFFCSYACSALEGLFGGYYDFLSGIAITNYCNAQEKIYDIMEYFAPSKRENFFLHIMNAPRKISPNAEDYYKLSLKRFIDALGEFSGKRILDADIMEQINGVNYTRNMLKEISEIICNFKTDVSPNGLISVAYGMNALPKERYDVIIADLLERLRSNGMFYRRSGAKILLYGIKLPNTEFVKILEEAGCRVYLGDFFRSSEEAPISNDPVGVLAKKYFTQSMTTHMENSSKPLAKQLFELCDDMNIDGVIFLSEKFCIQQAYDYKVFKDMMDMEGIPILLIENDYSITSYEQSKTRLHAFVEML
jgi:benzoyl-CoA reductase/2-hydroxyglutaryl-CoA dehydratase subunit BcrC/BadD/HgdB